MLKDYIQLEDLGGEYREIFDLNRSGVPTAVFGVTQGEKYHIGGSLRRPVLYIAKDAVYAKKAQTELEAISGEKVVYLSAKDDVLLYKKAFNKESMYRRITALYDIKQGVKTVVTTFDSLLQLFPMDVKSADIEKGKEYSLEKLCLSLVDMGYTRKELIEGKGDFTLHGDMLEVFPINADCIFRCDFFGDEVEKIRKRDPDSGEFIEETDMFTVVMAYDFYIEEGEREKLIKKVNDSVKKVTSIIAKTKARQIGDDLISALSSGTLKDCLSFIMPVSECSTSNIFNYLPDDVAIVYDESKLIKESALNVLKEHEERFKTLYRSGEVLDFSVRQYADIDDVSEMLKDQPQLALQNITSSIGFFNPVRTIRLNATPIDRYTANRDELFSDLKNWKFSGYRAIICCGNSSRAQKLFDTLENENVFCHLSDNFEKNFSGVKVTSFYLGTGFVCHEAKLAVIGTGDLYLQADPVKKIKKRRNDLFQAPSIGDFAVHETYGIGKIVGTKKISTQDGTKDYIEVEYRDGDRLYIPVEQMDKLTKYLGGDKSPQLSKIGGMEFERIKQRVRECISRMTINLKKLYSERQKQTGFRFSPDNELMEEFEESFEFTPTEDQLQSIKEIKEDMESGKVMDRLLCGDVGYGKTEVAIRAAFKAILDGKQVALVCPTTILSQQHYNTCKKRFKNFGVRLDVINRFRNAAEKNDIAEKLASGDIDMIVGTHALFSKNIKFNDLGLLILDEEQRFGVEHKEKLKEMKTTVDTLTMTATPIPRTLHMSLTGIRDISTINTPPQRRIPVQTYVVEESDAIIQDAVNKECARGGQTFILYNRVESIYSFADRIKGILPDVKISVAHGQMPEKQLEDTVTDFYEGKADVLISTTIIENGIDLPNANTIIVIDADKLGLSTLYQLKGRVGRSDRMAHAYFTYSPNKVLTGEAYSRLNALMEFTEMGSGYKIALRDLEIRGAGNVLGREQHGHMDKIGYELYSKLLKEQLGEVVKNYEIELDIRLTAFIPEGYISNSAMRMECYKQIAEIRNEADKNRVVGSMTENYGELPLEAENLISIALLKVAAADYGIIKIFVSKNAAEITLKDINSLNNEKLNKSLSDYKDKCKLTFEANPVIVFTDKADCPEDRLDEVYSFLIG